MGNDLVHVVVDGGVATVTLASPGNRNALSRHLVADLGAALDVAEARAGDGSVRAIVLGHVPPAFCAGADLKERRMGPPDSAPFVRVLQRLMDAAVPTIAAVSGPARAGGIGLMAACDLVVVQRDVTFALTEVRIGVAAAVISVPILRRVTPAKIAVPMLTGEPFDTEFAREIGLVTHVSDDVHGTVDVLCEAVMVGAPRAIAATKRLLRVVPTLDRNTAFAEMRALSDELFRGADAAEGMAAFREKRPPVWPTLST